MKTIDSNTPPAAVKPSVFLHGITGGGKSTWATTGGRPLVILTEPKAVSVLRQLNPLAFGIVPEGIQDLLTIVEKLGLPDWLAGKGVDRIVLDSYTGLTEAMGAWLRADTNGASILSKSMEIQEFGDVGKYALAVVQAIQLTGLASVIIGRSTSRRVGREEVIQPDSVGKSINSLPGRLLPTAEARFDHELGYVVDTTPADHSQRCGLPWVPQVFKGACLDYLGIIEAGPQVDMDKVREDVARAAAEVQARAEAAPKVEVPFVSRATGTEGQEPRTVQVPATAAKSEAPKPPRTPRAAAPAAPPAPKPSTLQDPEWQALMERLVLITRGRPEQERAEQVRAWDTKFANDPLWAKKDLCQLLDVTERLNAKGCPDPDKDPTGYREAFAVMVREIVDGQLQASKTTASTPEVEAFVAGVCDERPASQPDQAESMPPMPAKPLISQEQWQDLETALTTHKIPRQKFIDYLQSKAAMSGPNLNQVHADVFAKLWPTISDPAKRGPFIDYLNATNFLPF